MSQLPGQPAISPVRGIPTRIRRALERGLDLHGGCQRPLDVDTAVDGRNGAASSRNGREIVEDIVSGKVCGGGERFTEKVEPRICELRAGEAMKRCFGGYEERSGGTEGIALFSIADDAYAAREGHDGKKNGRERLSHKARIHGFYIISRD